MRLKGMNALVTGSARGIGKATALRFAEEGANVVINYIQAAEEANQVVEIVRAHGVKSFAVRADIGVSAEVRQMITESLREIRMIDILGYNACRGIANLCH